MLKDLSAKCFVTADSTALRETTLRLGRRSLVHDEGNPSHVNYARHVHRMATRNIERRKVRLNGTPRLRGECSPIRGTIPWCDTGLVGGLPRSGSLGARRTRKGRARLALCW